jgi:TPR repeat protein
MCRGSHMNAAAIACIFIAAAFVVTPCSAADCVSRAIGALESGTPSSVVGALRRDGRRGNVPCKYILGMWALTGTGMRQDEALGLRLLTEAAQGGLPAAQAQLGVSYANGVGVERDDVEAALWYRRAAERGDALSQLSLGAASFLGVGVEKDRLEAYKWTGLAAKQGDQKAQSHLSIMAAEMSATELSAAQERVESFRPKRSRREVGPTRWELLLLFGIRGHPTEMDRFE